MTPPNLGLDAAETTSAQRSRRSTQKTELAQLEEGLLNSKKEKEGLRHRRSHRDEPRSIIYTRKATLACVAHAPGGFGASTAGSDPEQSFARCTTGRGVAHGIMGRGKIRAILIPNGRPHTCADPGFMSVPEGHRNPPGF